MKRNAPGREAEGVVCLLGHADSDAYSTSIVRLQFLLKRGVPLEWASVLAPAAFGEAAR